MQIWAVQIQDAFVMQTQDRDRFYRRVSKTRLKTMQAMVKFGQLIWLSAAHLHFRVA